MRRQRRRLTIVPTLIPRGSGNNPNAGKLDPAYKIKEWGYIFSNKRNTTTRSVIGGNIILNELGYYCHFFHQDYIFYRNIENRINKNKIVDNLKSVFRIHYFNKQFGDFSNIMNINILLSKLTPEEQYERYHNYIFHTGDKTACLYAILCGINTILYQKQDNKYGRILFLDKNKKYIKQNLLNQSKQILIGIDIIEFEEQNQIILCNKNEYIYRSNCLILNDTNLKLYIQR
jgi:hypothetical protein